MRILLEAPILTTSGYGEHSRLVFRALKSLRKNKNVEIHINPLNWGQTSWMSRETKEKLEIETCIRDFANYMSNQNQAGEPPIFDLQIHVGIPNEFEQRAPYSICVTAGIETDRVDPSWLMKTHRGIKKIIVPSVHARDGFLKTSYEITNEEKNLKTMLECASKVEVVPYPAKQTEPKHLDFSLDTEFNFLSVALLGPRKNIENMIRWFVEEFKNDDVGLILKTGRATGSIIDREETDTILKNVLENHKERKCKVFLLHGDLTEEELHSLYQREDVHAYVTATHGEGFGLPLFEAAYSGLPVIATDWSAHLDFLSGPYKAKGNKTEKQKKLFARVGYDLKPIPQHVVWKDIIPEGAKWAYPKENDLKRQMRNVYKNYGMYKKWAIALQSHVCETHHPKKIIDKMANSIISDLDPRLIRALQEEPQQEEVVVFE